MKTSQQATLNHADIMALMEEYSAQYGFRMICSDDINHFLSWFGNRLLDRLECAENVDRYEVSPLRANTRNLHDEEDWNNVCKFIISTDISDINALKNLEAVSDFIEELKLMIDDARIDRIEDEINLHVGNYLREVYRDGDSELDLDNLLNQVKYSIRDTILSNMI